MSGHSDSRLVTREGFAFLAREHGWEEATIKLIVSPPTPKLGWITVGKLAVKIVDWPSDISAFTK